MQFKSIVTVLSLALAVTASPAPNPTSSGPSCQQGETLKCCNKTTASGLSLVSIGDILSDLLHCNAVVQVLGVAGCNSNQDLNCCTTSNTGSLNILSNDCTNVSL